MSLHRIKNCGVDNECWDCCQRSGGSCCWSPCCAIVASWDFWRCYWSDAGCSVRAPNVNVEPTLYARTNPIGESFKCFPAPYDPNQVPFPTGCHVPGGGPNVAGMYWRSVEPVMFEAWNTAPGSQTGCPPASQALSPPWYMWVRHNFIADPVTGKHWQLFFSASAYIIDGAPNQGPAVTPADANFTTEYGCCGAVLDDDHSCTADPGPPYYSQRAQGSVRVVSFPACCRDTTRTDISGCGRVADGLDPALCPCVNNAWGWDSTSGERNCCASCQDDECIDLPY